MMMRLQVRILAPNFAIFSKFFQTLRTLAWPLHFQRPRAIEGPFLSKRGVSGLSVHVFVIHVLLHIPCQNWLWKLQFLVHKMCLFGIIGSNPKLSYLILATFSCSKLLKLYKVVIHAYMCPLKSKNQKIGKYFVIAPSAPLCYL